MICYNSFIPSLIPSLHVVFSSIFQDPTNPHSFSQLSGQPCWHRAFCEASAILKGYNLIGKSFRSFILRKQLTFFGSKPFKLIKLMVKRGPFLAPNPFNLILFPHGKKKTLNEAKCCGLFFSIARPHPSMSTDPRCVILLCAGHFGLTLTQVPVVAMGGVTDLLGLTVFE